MRAEERRAEQHRDRADSTESVATVQYIHTYKQTNTQTHDKTPDLQTLFALRRCNCLPGPALFNVKSAAQVQPTPAGPDQQQDPRVSHLSSQQRGWFPLPTRPFALLLGFPGSLAALHCGHSFSTRRTLRPSVREGAGAGVGAGAAFGARRETRDKPGSGLLRSLCLWHRQSEAAWEQRDGETRDERRETRQRQETATY